MKKIALVILGVFCLGILAAPAAAANHNDFKAIQKAVKKNPAYEEGREAKWLKILITDSRHFKVDDGNCEIDLKAVFADLKKAGPSAPPALHRPPKPRRP